MTYIKTNNCEFKLIELVKCLKKFKFIEACSPVEGETPKVQFSSEFKEMLKQDR